MRDYKRDNPGVIITMLACIKGCVNSKPSFAGMVVVLAGL